MQTIMIKFIQLIVSVNNMNNFIKYMSILLVLLKTRYVFEKHTFNKLKKNQ